MCFIAGFMNSAYKLEEGTQGEIESSVDKRTPNKSNHDNVNTWKLSGNVGRV